MNVREDFAGKVAGLCSSIPAEAVANLLRALMPRVPVQTRPPAMPEPLIGDDGPKPYVNPLTGEAPDPLRRLGRKHAPRVRKVVSNSTLVRATGATHARDSFYWWAARIAVEPIAFGELVSQTAAAFAYKYKSSKPLRETTEIKLRDGLSKLGYFEIV